MAGKVDVGHLATGHAILDAHSGKYPKKFFLNQMETQKLLSKNDELDQIKDLFLNRSSEGDLMSYCNYPGRGKIITFFFQNSHDGDQLLGALEMLDYSISNL